MRKKLTSVSIKHPEKTVATRLKSNVGNVGVLLGAAPPLHTHCNETNLYSNKMMIDH